MLDDNFDYFFNLAHQKPSVYTERAACVSLIAKMAIKLGYRVGMKKDNGVLANTFVSSLIYIDLPSGQISWHIADEDMHYFAGLPSYEGEWDGHDTKTKYERVAKPNL